MVGLASQSFRFLFVTFYRPTTFRLFTEVFVADKLLGRPLAPVKALAIRLSSSTENLMKTMLLCHKNLTSPPNSQGGGEGRGWNVTPCAPWQVASFLITKNFGRSAGAATLGLRPGAAAVQVTTIQSPETYCYNLPATHRLNGLRAKDGITSKTLRRSASRELVVAAAAALIHLRCRWEVGNVLLHCSTLLHTAPHNSTAPHCSTQLSPLPHTLLQWTLAELLARSHSQV